MQATFRSGRPKKIDYTPAVDVASGEVVVFGVRIGIAHRPIAANDLGALSVGGAVYTVAGDAAIAIGKKVYWNNTSNKATETATDNLALGYAVSACSADGSSFDVALGAQTADISPIEGYYLWYNAEEETYNNAGTTPAAVDEGVYTWGDLSTSARDATQSTSGKRPLLKSVNGYGVLRLDGSNDVIRSSSFNLPQPFTVYAVCKASGDSTRLFDGNTVNDAFLTTTGSGVRPRAIYAGSGPVATSEGSSVPDVLAMVFNGASSLLECGRRNKATGNPGAGNWTAGVCIGGAGNEAGGFCVSADLYEFIVYSGAHSITQRNTMREYFASRWSHLPLLQWTGDSLTAGTGSTGGNDYPTQTLALLAGGASAYTSSNIAVGGSTAATWGGTAGAAMIDNAGQYSSVLRKGINIHWAGTNDILAGTSAAAVYQILQDSWAVSRAQGMKVIAATIIARGNFSGGQETVRQSLNTLIRSDTSLYDALNDVAALSAFDAQADSSNTTYYDADTIHLNNTGYGLIAASAKTAIETVLAQSYVSLSS